MKRLITVLLALLLTLGSTSVMAEEASVRTGTELSYDRIVEMTHYMRQLAMGDYLTIKQAPEAMHDTVRDWAAGIDGTPRLAVQLDINALSYLVDVRAAFIQEPPIVSMEAESNMVSEVWHALVRSASGESGLSESGYEDIMNVNSLLSARMLYAEEGVTGNALYIVLYDGAAPIFLNVNAENGAVSISGMFLPSAKLSKCQNYGQVALWLMMAGCTMTCTEIKPE